MLSIRDSIEVQGRRVGYHDAGDGPPLVFLHGIGGNADVWDAQLDSFVHDHRVIAWDAPGYGASDCLPMPNPQAADYAGVLAGLFDALGLDRVTLVGHSLGGLMAAAFAARWPQRVERLVLADCASGHARLAPETRLAKLRGRLDPLAHQSTSDYANARAPRLLSAAASDEKRRRAATLLAQIRVDGYAQAARMLSEADIFLDLPAVTARTLVLCGTEDRITPESANQVIAAALRHGTYCALPDAGHWSYLDQPERFNDAVRAFLLAREAA